MNPEFAIYNEKLDVDRRAICVKLANELHKNLPNAESKIWHGAPVWFINGNPIVGYANRKHNVSLLFWSGQSFDEPGLKPEGNFKAAEATYTDIKQIDTDDIARWIEKAKKIQWDYKNIVKRKGELVRLNDSH